MELVANKHRPYITAFLFFTTVPFATFGGLLARTFASHTAAGWRWNYYLNLIVNSIAAILFFICYHPPSHKELDRTKSLGKKLKEIDYIGVLLFSGGLTSFILGLSWGGGLHPVNPSCPHSAKNNSLTESSGTPSPSSSPSSLASSFSSLSASTKPTCPSQTP